MVEEAEVVFYLPEEFFYFVDFAFFEADLFGDEGLDLLEVLPGLDEVIGDNFDCSLVIIQSLNDPLSVVLQLQEASLEIRLVTLFLSL